MIVVPDIDRQLCRWDPSAITWAVAAHGRCPVIVWRPVTNRRATAPVVVGVDGSPVSARALDFAASQAARWHVPLIAVMAWSDVYFDTERDVLGVVTDWASVEQDHRRLLAEQLAEVTARYPDAPVERVLTHDRPIRALLKAATGAQLLVVGSRGQGGFPNMLLGSVSRSLIDYSPCPLAIVRPADAR